MKDYTVHGAAERIVAGLKSRYGAPLKIVPVSESEFAHLDLDAYRRFRETMERHGYKFLSDLEVLGLTNLPTPVMARTMIRCMVSADGVICASHYQVKPTLGWRLTHFLAGLLNLRFIVEPFLFLESLLTRNYYDFDSELGDTYVTTSNAVDAGKLSLPRSVDAKFLVYGTSIDELRAAHEARLRAAAARTGASPTIMSSEEEVLAMQARLQERKNVHRAASGWITRKELLAFSEGNTALADEIFEEVQRVLAQSRKSPLVA